MVNKVKIDVYKQIKFISPHKIFGFENMFWISEELKKLNS